MENKKCILLVRVSTEAQDYEGQLFQLRKKAEYDGYSNDNIIEIANKESAIKLSESEMMGLNQMKESIEQDNSINCIYVWEISRLSRQLDVLFSMIKYLKDRHINLHIYNNNLSMFLVDGKENPTFSMFSAMFGSMAESEMKLKKERFKRSKDLLKKQNKYLGGPILYGYRADEDKNIVEDKETAENVRLMFQLYASQEYSVKKLVRELSDRGIIIGKTEYLAAHRLMILLSKSEYIGQYSGKGYHYSPILSEKLYKKCREIAKNNRNEPKKVTKYTSLFKKIFKCECGYTMIGIPSHNKYICNMCGNTLNMTLFNDTFYPIVQNFYYKYLLLGEEEKSVENVNKIKELEEKIEVIKANIIKQGKKINKINHDIYMTEKLDETIGYGMLNEINNSMAKDQAKMKKMIEEKELLSIQSNQQENDPLMNSINAAQAYDLNISDELKQKIVQKVLKEIRMKKISRFNNQFTIVPNNPAYNDDKNELIIELNSRTKIPQIIEKE